MVFKLFCSCGYGYSDSNEFKFLILSFTSINYDGAVISERWVRPRLVAAARSQIDKLITVRRVITNKTRGATRTNCRGLVFDVSTKKLNRHLSVEGKCVLLIEKNY